MKNIVAKHHQLYTYDLVSWPERQRLPTSMRKVFIIALKSHRRWCMDDTLDDVYQTLPKSPTSESITTQSQPAESASQSAPGAQLWLQSPSRQKLL